MKIVVTGASGFLGNKLVNELNKRNFETCAVSRKATHFKNSCIVKSYMDTPGGDVLIHLAEDSNRLKVNKMGKAYLDSNLALAKALVKKDFKRIVYASSVVLYGDKSSKPYKPGDAVEASDIYSETKMQCERFYKKYNAVIARFSNVYGDGMSSDNVVTKILNQINITNDVFIWDDKPIRDFLHVNDGIEALIKMATGSKNGIYNVASGKSISIRELFDIVSIATNNDKEYNLFVTNPSEISSNIMIDISDTVDSFSWNPKIKLEHGIKELLMKQREMR